MDLIPEERCLTSQNHCTGPKVVSDGDLEYILGSAWTTSAYSTHFSDPAPHSPDYIFRGCYNPQSWSDDVSYSVGMSNSVQGVVECHDTCMRLGFNYFAMECANSEGVTCNCYPHMGDADSGVYHLSQYFLCIQYFQTISI